MGGIAVENIAKNPEITYKEIKKLKNGFHGSLNGDSGKVYTIFRGSCGTGGTIKLYVGYQ